MRPRRYFTTGRLVELNETFYTVRGRLEPGTRLKITVGIDDEEKLYAYDDQIVCCYDEVSGA